MSGIKVKARFNSAVAAIVGVAVALEDIGWATVEEAVEVADISIVVVTVAGTAVTVDLY